MKLSKAEIKEIYQTEIICDKSDFFWSNQLEFKKTIFLNILKKMNLKEDFSVANLYDNIHLLKDQEKAILYKYLKHKNYVLKKYFKNFIKYNNIGSKNIFTSKVFKRMREDRKKQVDNFEENFLKSLDIMFNPKYIEAGRNLHKDYTNFMVSLHGSWMIFDITSVCPKLQKLGFVNRIYNGERIPFDEYFLKNLNHEMMKANTKIFNYYFS